MGKVASGADGTASAAGWRLRLTNANTVPGLMLLVLGALIRVAMGDVSGRSWIFPSAVTTVILVCGATLVLIGWTKQTPWTSDGRSTNWRDTVLFATGMVLYVILIPLIGMVMASVVATIGFGVALDSDRTIRSRARIALVGLSAGVVIALLFGRALSVPLPGWSPL